MMIYLAILGTVYMSPANRVSPACRAGNLSCHMKFFQLGICDVPQEKGASRKIPKLFWDTCGNLRESCGKFRDSGNERKSEFAR